jgi:hypothetical protein
MDGMSKLEAHDRLGRLAAAVALVSVLTVPGGLATAVAPVLADGSIAAGKVRSVTKPPAKPVKRKPAPRPITRR